MVPDLGKHKCPLRMPVRSPEFQEISTRYGFTHNRSAGEQRASWRHARDSLLAGVGACTIEIGCNSGDFMIMAAGLLYLIADVDLSVSR